MIRHADGRITGNPVFNVVHGGLPQIRSLFDMGVLPLALTYRMPGTAEFPNPYYRNPEVRDLILLAFDHAHDQGWAAGSAMGTAYGVNLGLAGYNISIFLMRDELEKAGILDREIATSHYYSGFREHYKPMEFAHGIAGADGMRTVALFKLMTIASMPQSDLQIELMRRYCAWLRASLTVSRGLNELIKPDGTLYHHWNPYWAGYGNHGIEMAARLGYFLRGTAFELPRELRENVKKALLTARFVAHKYALPISINGRWPMFEDSLIPALAGFAYGAMMMEDGKIDPELAAAFMRLYDPEYPAVKERFFEVTLGGNTFASTPGNCADMLRFAAVCGVAAEDDPQGNLALPYAGAMFHRRGNAFVAIKGNSKYIWDYESQACGQLGRNLSRGSIIVYSAGDPVTLKANGYEWPGWDWARIPGTTTIRKTFAQMDPLLIKDSSRHNTDQTAVGGMSFGENGVYMMRFHDTTYDKSFCFDQSVWCYGD
ncbi:MAG: hypothetical protein IKD46_08570, partial [Lentisphaeria bacterium]|nr:hypothetical protein [Lentisphaeria bacterium]